MFAHLFSPLKLGSITLPNRICFVAHPTNFATRGRLTDRHIAYYVRRARGGCGLIILGELTIHEADRPWLAMIEAYKPDIVEDYQRLTSRLHELETPVLAQLCHHGFQGTGAISRRPIWAPSATADIIFNETAKAMEPEDMVEVIEAYCHGARLARDGGFDGLEIDMGHQSLLRQFLSPISNLRQDKYGGNLENRMRFPLEVIDGVRAAVGQDFTIGVRLCVDEMFWGGITAEEACEIARTMEAMSKIDFFNTSVGTFYQPHLFMASMHVPVGFTVEAAWQLKRSSGLPVIASHQIDLPQMAEDILAEGKADAIGVIRSLICDPDAPKKAKEGRPEGIRHCVRENEGCIGRINRSRTLSCIQNPDVGYEWRGRQGGSRPRAKKKRVMVVGAGPAGMEAARAARERGHDVTLFERRERLGGQINLAKLGAGREGLEEIIHYQEHMLVELDVEVITGVEVRAELVLELNPDSVILATGSNPKKRPVAGNYGHPHVLSVVDVLEGDIPVGDRILFIDEHGSHRSTATVELLAKKGKRVDMVTSEPFVGVGLAPLGDLYLTRQRLLQLGVTFRTDTVIDGIEGKKVIARDIYTNDRLLLEGYDTVVLDMGDEPEAGLYFKLKGFVKELYRAGDCVAPRGLCMAILEGRRCGEKP